MPRTRSPEAHRKVIEAAVALFSDRGIEATSMDAIAEHSGVSKATIYKHWPDKDSLALEVLSHIHGLDEPSPPFDSGDYRRDLIDLLSYRPSADRQPLIDKIWPHLMAYSAGNRAFGNQWRARVTEPARQRLIAILRRGQSRGLIKKSLDHETAVAILLGPFIYRHVFTRHLARLAPKDLERNVARAFLAAFGTARLRALSTRSIDSPHAHA